MTRIRVDTDPAVVFANRNDWRALVGDSAANWIFSTPEWIESWVDAFGADAKFACVSAYEDGQLAGALPVVWEPGGWQFLFSGILKPVNGICGDYFAPIVRAGREADLTTALIDAALEHFNDRSVLVLPHVPVDHASYPILADYFTARGFAWYQTRFVCPRLTYAADYPATERSFKASHRGDIRRQKRRMEETGTVRLVRLTDAATAAAHLDRFVETYDSRWMREGQGSIFDDARMRRFYVNLIHRLGPHLHFSLLTIGDVVVSYHFGFEFGGWLYWYKPTFDVKYEHLSPSKVHLSLLIEDGIARGLCGVDLLSGAEEYKFHWANGRRETATFMAARPKWHPALHFNARARQLRQRAQHA